MAISREGKGREETTSHSLDGKQSHSLPEPSTAPLKGPARSNIAQTSSRDPRAIPYRQPRPAWADTREGTHAAAADVLERAAAQLIASSVRHHEVNGTHAAVDDGAAGSDATPETEGQPGGLADGRGVVRGGAVTGLSGHFEVRISEGCSWGGDRTYSSLSARWAGRRPGSRRLGCSAGWRAT